MPEGYGQIGDGKRVRTTHRVAYELSNGPIPDGQLIRHKCDNRRCVNPGHLLAGTQRDNMRDAVERNRVARGFRLPHTRLTEQDVRDIRARYAVRQEGRFRRANAVELAAEYGIHPQYLKDIVSRKERSNVV